MIQLNFLCYNNMKVTLTDKIEEVSIYLIVFYKETNIFKLLQKYGFDIKNQDYLKTDIINNNVITLYYNNYKVILISISKKKFSNENLKILLSNKDIYNSISEKKVLLIPIENMNHLIPQIEGFILSNYKFDKYLQNPSFSINELLVLIDKVNSKSKKELDKSLNIISSVSMIRDLGNEPANILNPDTFTNFIKKKSQENDFFYQEIKYKELKKLGMNSLISVSEGSRYKARLVIISNNKKLLKNSIILVGKGVMFDSGGVSLKSSKNMYEMKSDMLGAATVLGVINTLTKNRSKNNVIGLLPIVENMIGTKATKPGDIVKSMSGKTIEIRNTDAEGRLIMIDAITYSKRFSPRIIIDISTLTGMQSKISCGLFTTVISNNSNLVNKLKKSGEKTNERVWEFPLYQEHLEMVKSDVADLKNDEFNKKCNSSTILAGAFISHFIDKTPWLHLDIAGPSWSNIEENYLKKGSTGIGLRLLIDFIEN